MPGDKKSGKIYPHIWKYGPDPLRHDIHEKFLKARAQAQFRNEGWQLSFEDYYSLWHKQWDNRGRGGENVCMTRYDPDSPWSKNNCYIISRQDHLIIQGQRRKSMNMRYNKLKATK